MKQVLKLPHCNIEIEAGSVAELFEKGSQVTEIFGERHCGLCKSESIKQVTRVVKGDDGPVAYCEWHCEECFARLALGRSRDKVNLFPKRKLDKQGKPTKPKDKTGEYGPHNGWTKYKGPIDADGDE